MPQFFVLALTNAAAGRDDDYNRWFDDVHVPEILAVDGFASVQRMTLTPEQRAPAPPPYKYAALYTVGTEDLKTTLRLLGEAVAGGTKTDAGDPERRAIWVYGPLGPQRSA